MDSNEDAVLCPVCYRLYDDPRSLPCGHSFCCTCISQVAENRLHFPCPSCRADVKLDPQGVKGLPKNYSLGNIIESQKKMLSAQCTEHKKSLDMFCAQCDVMICSKCLFMSHSGHRIVETEDVFNERKGKLTELLQSTKPWKAQIKEKTDEIRSSRQSVQETAKAINANIDEIFRRWSDDLETQRQILRRHVDDETEQRMKVFDDYVTVLESANTDISNLQTEINTTLSKDTTSVVQLCQSMETGHEKVVKKAKEMLATSFVPPKDFKIDVCAPWMEEVIQNIKLVEPGQREKNAFARSVSMILEENETLQKYYQKKTVTNFVIAVQHLQFEAEECQLRMKDTKRRRSFGAHVFACIDDKSTTENLPVNEIQEIQSKKKDVNSKTNKTAVGKIHTDNTLCVVSMYLGRSSSGYAISFKVRDQIDIFMNNWKPDWDPIVLLLDHQQRFVAFGFDAVNKYEELVDNNSHYDYYYFDHFNMALHDNTTLSQSETIEDKQGKRMRASVLFMHSIRYLKEMAEKGLKDCGKEIKWILTVPAKWNDAAKQFMREAAADAGIKDKDLWLVSEPEAASICYMELINSCEVNTPISELTAICEGSKFMVVDMGGGIVDVTVLQLVAGRKLKKLHVATGGPWSGSKVNENFRIFMGNILGQEVWDKFCSEHRLEKLLFEKDFERTKRSIDLDSDKRICIRLPIQVKDIFKELTKKDLADAIAIEGGFQGKVEMMLDKLKLDPKLVQSFFDDSLKSIVKHLKQLLKIIDVETICLVGGFAESPLVCSTIRQTFPGKRIVSHVEAGLCVLKGAILYGHDLKFVTAHVCKSTYGTEAMRYFIEGQDPEDQKIIIDGQPFCKVFVKHAEMGQIVSSDDTSTCELDAVMTVMTIPVFVSQKKNPVYTSDPSCRLLGKIKVNMVDISGRINRKVIVMMTSRESELKVEVVNAQSGEKVAASFDLLGE